MSNTISRLSNGIRLSRQAEIPRLFQNSWLGLLPVLIYLLVFYLIPVVFLVLASFRVKGVGVAFTPNWTFENYLDLVTSSSHWIAYGRSLTISSLTVLLSTLCAYPLAYTIIFVLPRHSRSIVLWLIVAPFWTSFIIRSFAWQLLLADNSLLNHGLKSFKLPTFSILYTHTATVLGFTLFGTMLITLNLCSVMESINPNLLAASANLGATRWQTFVNVILPLSLPGLLIGAVLTFIIAFGDYIVPSLLGGGVKTVLAQMMVGAMTTHFNIPRAATYAVVMLLTMMLVTLPMLHWAGRGLNSEPS